MPGGGRSGVQRQKQVIQTGGFRRRMSSMAQPNPFIGQPVFEVAVVAPGLGVFDYDGPPSDAGLPDSAPNRGDWLVVPFARRVLLGLVVNVRQKTNTPVKFKRRAALGVFRPIPPLSSTQIEFFEFIATYYRTNLGAVLSMAIPAWIRDAKNLKAYCDPKDLSRPTSLQKLIQSLETGQAITEPLGKASYEDGDHDLGSEAIKTSAHTLTHEQTLVVNGASRALALTPPNTSSPTPVYVQGVTGSGKTRVYTELIKRLWIDQPGAQVLYLVPEIALTPVLETRLRQGLELQAKDLSVLHSGMTDRQRALAWMRAVRNEVRLILGTRLSLLTPLENLALIIVDEEHDSSYKSQDTVRYSARDLAAYKAAQQKIRLVLGSATPSLESLAQIEKGRYRLVRLLKQATGMPRALLTLVDLNKEHITVAGVLTESVREAVQDTLARGRQVLFFLNRRGYAPLLSCLSCGWTQGCEHCSVSTVLHKKAGQWQMVCHHCGLVSKPIQRCPSCGAAELSGVGLAIQSLEARLRETFSGIALTRVDSDSAGSPEKMAQVLKRLQEPKAEIILATQILAKGHDLPGLSTVVVLDVDAQLQSPEFRAPEWLFSTLLQVSGRAGRHEAKARVFLQTRYPGHALFQGLKAEDPASYLTGLLEERRQAGLPPYGYIAALRMSARHEAALHSQFSALYQQLSQNSPKECKVYRPSPSYPEKRADQYRWHMVIESSRRGPLNATLDMARAIAQANQMRDLIIDVDPLGLS